MQVPAAVQHALDTCQSPRLCACGTAIQPVQAEGFPAFYPRHCPTCEVIHARSEEAAREEQVKRGQGIPPLYLGSSFDNLHDPLPSQAVISTCRKFAACRPTGMGLYLWSHTNGNGKSHLAAAIVSANDDGFFVNANDLLDALRDSYDTGGRCKTFDMAIGAGILALDDLGGHRTTEWGVDRLYRLLNARSSHLASTVITSNFSPDELEHELGSRIVSRIVGMCAIVHVDGPDHRRLRRRDLI